MAPIISLTTDFGLQDAYVGIMKGVIVGIAPEATLVDISHLVPPQDVFCAAYLLLTTFRYFPGTAVHLAVVDPGVGSDRHPVAVSTPHGMFVGPDNGIFTLVLRDQGVIEPGGALSVPASIIEPPLRAGISRTFHGRDIFAPAAARLAAGTPVEDLGPAARSLAQIDFPEPRRQGDAIVGNVIHIDHFGNAITDIRGSVVPERAQVEVSGRVIPALSESYRDREINAIIGSSGLLEIALRDGSAAVALGLTRGDGVVVEPAE